LYIAKEFIFQLYVDSSINSEMMGSSHVTSSSSSLPTYPPSLLLTPTTPTVVSTPSRIVTYTISSSESSISFLVPIMLRPRINLAASKETNGLSK
jgi:hypothetical protein